MTVDRSRLPLPGAPRPFHFPAISRATLANGLQVRAVPLHAVPVVSMVAIIPGGSSADPADRAGLAAFAADLLDDGIGDLDGVGLADALARIGAELDVEVWPDAAVITVTALSRHAPRAVALLGDALMRPRFADVDVERVRGLRLDRLRQMRAQAQARADRGFVQQVYGTHPYGHHGIGTAAGIRAATREEIAAFHASRCTAGAVTVVVGGAIAPDAAHALVHDALGGWTAAAAPVSASVDGAIPPAGARRAIVVPRPGAPQSELRVGQVGVARATTDYHPLLLWNAVLGGQFVSRLNVILRQQKGYTYGVRSGFDFRRGRGPFTVQTSVQAGATADAVQDILREVTDMCGERPATAAELDRAKASVGRGYPLGFETAQQVARGVAQLALHHLADDHFERFVPLIDAVDASTALAAARRHVRPLELTTVVVGDPDTVVPQFEALGMVVEIAADDEAA